MEIADYFRAARKRLWLIILLPLLAAGVAGGLLYSKPQTYTSTATIDAPSLVGGLNAQYTGAQGVNQFVSAFQATSTGPVIRDKTEAATGVDSTLLSDNLSVTQRGTSSSVAVSFTSTKRTVPQKVVETVSSLTLDALFNTQVADAQARVAAAKQSVDTANKAISDFNTTHRMADPQKAYEAQLSRVNALVQQQASLRATGNAVGAAAMSAPITTAQAQLNAFVPILSQYSALQAAALTADTALSAANNDLAQATAQQKAADPTKVVFVGGARLDDRMAPIIQTTVAVAAAALILALLLVFGLEMLARSRGTREARADTAADSAPAREPAAVDADDEDRTRSPAPTPAPAPASAPATAPALLGTSRHA